MGKGCVCVSRRRLGALEGVRLPFWPEDASDKHKLGQGSQPHPRYVSLHESVFMRKDKSNRCPYMD